MNCHLCQEKFDAYRGGNLLPDMKIQVESHLRSCSFCMESYNLQLLAERTMNQEKEMVSNPFLSARIMSHIENEETVGSKTNPAFIRILKPALITISMAAAVFIGVLIGNIYEPAVKIVEIPLEMALIDDTTIESIDILSNE